MPESPSTNPLLLQGDAEAKEDAAVVQPLPMRRPALSWSGRPSITTSAAMTAGVVTEAAEMRAAGSDPQCSKGVPSGTPLYILPASADHYCVIRFRYGRVVRFQLSALRSYREFTNTRQLASSKSGKSER